MSTHTHIQRDGTSFTRKRSTGGTLSSYEDIVGQTFMDGTRSYEKVGTSVGCRFSVVGGLEATLFTLAEVRDHVKQR